LCARYASQLEKLSRQGLLEQDGDGVRLTAAGLKYGNVAFAAFLPDPRLGR
jgi:hypothetical protein